ncbi:MAG: hypothetical protein AAFO07_27225, partial [Bacteroidota bacterium]
MTKNKPFMQIWTDAWHQVQPNIFKDIYAKNAFIFPPNRPAVQGNENILDFMKGGMGKVDVLFETNHLTISENLAFEFGVFKDVERKTQ